LTGCKAVFGNQFVWIQLILKKVTKLKYFVLDFTDRPAVGVEASK